MRQMITLVFCLMVLGMNAQINVGFKIGANINNPTISGLGSLTENQNSYTGFTANVFTEIPLDKNFSFAPGLSYTQKGFGVSQTTSTNLLGIDVPLGVMAVTRVNYIEAPLMLKYFWGNEKASFYAMGGPSLSYATNAILTTKARVIIDFNVMSTDLNLSDDMYNRLELGGAIGAGGQVNLSTGSLFVEATYNHSFTNMLNNPIVDLNIKNGGFNIGAGYKYQF